MPNIQQRAARYSVVLFPENVLVTIYIYAVKNWMQELGVVFRAIPANCTWLVQQIDVSIEKVFKARMAKKWWNWIHRRAHDQKYCEKSRKINIENGLLIPREKLPKRLSGTVDAIGVLITFD